MRSSLGVSGNHVFRVGRGSRRAADDSNYACDVGECSSGEQRGFEWDVRVCVLLPVFRCALSYEANESESRCCELMTTLTKSDLPEVVPNGQDRIQGLDSGNTRLFASRACLLQQSSCFDVDATT